MKRNIIIIASLLAIVMIFGIIGSVFNTPSVKLPEKEENNVNYDDIDLSQYIVSSHIQVPADCFEAEGYDYKLYDDSFDFTNNTAVFVIENFKPNMDYIIETWLRFGPISLLVETDGEGNIYLYNFTAVDQCIVGKAKKIVILYDYVHSEFVFYNGDGSISQRYLVEDSDTLNVGAMLGDGCVDITTYAFPSDMLNLTGLTDSAMDSPILSQFFE